MDDFEERTVRKLRGIRDYKDIPDDPEPALPLTTEEQRANARAAETLRARLAMYGKPRTP